MEGRIRLDLLSGLSNVKARITSIENYLRLTPTWNYSIEQDAAVAIDIGEASLALSDLTDHLPSCVIFDEKKGEVHFGKG